MRGNGQGELGSERTSLLWAEVCLPPGRDYGPFSLFIQNQQSEESQVSFHLPHPRVDLREPGRLAQLF